MVYYCLYTATTGDLLDTEPIMFHIIDVVIPKIRADWEYVAYSMRYSIPEVKAFAKDSSNSKQSCMNLFIDWLSTPHDVNPKTWHTLLDRIKAIHSLRVVAEDIEKEIIERLTS